MRGAINVMEAVLILVVTVSIMFLAMPWVMSTIDRSSIISEASTMKDQLANCNDKLVETARTGSGNKCVFSPRFGTLKTEKEGIYYVLDSEFDDICDITSDWVEINPDKHVWMKCEKIGSRRLSYRWFWPIKSLAVEGLGLQGGIYERGSLTKQIKFIPDSQGFYPFTTLTTQVEFTTSVAIESGNILEISRVGVGQGKAILKATVK